MQMDKLPKKLEKDTIVETIFEVRFTSKTTAIANILLGLLFQEFRSEFPKVERLGVAELPQQIIQSDANIRYAHHYKLVGDRFALQIGEHVCSISCPRPYVGWSEFQPKIIELLEFLNKADLIDLPERFSVKYVNVVPTDSEGTLDGLRLSVAADNFELNDRPLNLRTEILEGDFHNLVQISSRITAKIRGAEEINGVLLDIDTIYRGKFQDIWSEIPALLEEAHSVEKQVFFGLLTKDTIEKLGPHW